MTFLHLGLAIAGIACVSIPILIHLLMRRRRKPVMWGAMRFLLEAYRRQRRKLMLEKWLLLAARCLIVLLAGLAIARPMLSGAGASVGGRTVYLLIDNGLAATAIGDDGRPAIDRHKETAGRLLAALGQSVSAGEAAADRVGLIAMGGPAQGIVVPPSVEVAGVGRQVDALEPTDSKTDIAGALALAASAIESEASRDRDGDSGRRVFVVLLSDFLEGSADIATGAALAKLPTGVRVVCSEPAAAAGNNMAVTSVDPVHAVMMSGAGGENVRVTVRRSGAAAAEEATARVRVRMEQVGAGAAPTTTTGRMVTATVRFNAGSEEGTASVQVPPVALENSPGGGSASASAGAGVLVAQLEPMAPGADVIAGDSTWRRPIEVREMLRVGIVAPRRFGERARVDQLDASEWVRLALRPGEGLGSDSGVDVVEIEPGGVDVPRLAGLDAVVLPRPDLLGDDAWRRLGSFASGGGLLIVMPPGGEAGSGVQLWSDKMVRELGLPWSLSREVRSVAAAPGGEGAHITVGAAAGTDSSGIDLMGVVRGELGDLTRAVSVFKMLPIESSAGAEAATGARLLTLVDGTTLVWAGAGGVPTNPGTGAANPSSPSPAQGATPAPATGASTRAAGAEPEGATQSPSGRGLIVYIASALELGWTDLPARPLMVPLLQELVRQGVGQARGSWSSIAGRPAAAPGRAVELVPTASEAPNSGGDAAPTTGGATIAGERIALDASGQSAEPARRAGVWRAVDDRGGTRGLVAINADWRAGRVGTQARPEVERWLQSGTGGGAPIDWIAAEDDPGGTTAAAMASLLAGGRQGPPISFPLLAAAAALALLEMWLARWASHAEIDSVTAAGAAAPTPLTPLGRAAA